MQILEKSEPMRTDCERPPRKAAIHLRRQGCRLQEYNLLKRMVWSIRSNPFLKSAKKSLALQLPLSQEAAHKILARRLYNGDGINIAHVLCEYTQMRFTTLCGGLFPDYFMAQFTIFLM